MLGDVVLWLVFTDRCAAVGTLPAVVAQSSAIDVADRALKLAGFAPRGGNRRGRRRDSRHSRLKEFPAPRTRCSLGRNHTWTDLVTLSPRRAGLMRVSYLTKRVVRTILAVALIGHYPVFAASPRSVQPSAGISEAERATIAMFERIAPSVVQVVALSATVGPFLEQEAGVSSGTGFVWDQAGHIVTNDHVVKGAKALAVRFASGEVAKAKVVGLAANYDLAVIQVEQTKSLPPPVPLGSSADLKVGQFAFAIGNPFGLDQSLTSGIISALKRRLPTEGGREIGNVIQTDAAVNPGNSGGPLLDSAGRVIGVTTAIISPSGSNAGIGFAIPVDTVNRIVPELIENGRVATPGIGIVAASEALATRLGVEGVAVVQVAPDSPAAHAGLRGLNLNTGSLGDVIVAADGKRVGRLSDLTDEVEQVGVGHSVHLSVKRGNQTRSVDVQVVDIGGS
jgi:S1-C subfamily serine protease